MPKTATAADETTTTESAPAGHYITVALAGKPMDCVPSGAWRMSAIRAFREGDIDTAMERILSPASYQAYLDIDPTGAEVNQFLTDLGERSGDPVGNSNGPTPSRRTTRRR